MHVFLCRDESHIKKPIRLAIETNRPI